MPKRSTRAATRASSLPHLDQLRLVADDALEKRDRLRPASLLGELDGPAVLFDDLALVFRVDRRLRRSCAGVHRIERGPQRLPLLRLAPPRCCRVRPGRARRSYSSSSGALM